MNKAEKQTGHGSENAGGAAPYKIGLAGAVEIIIGTVIGSGIYIMIGPLAAAAGPGLFLCYLIALVVAVAASICYAQVASVFPATAATYRYTKMFYGDFIGFAVGWFRLVGSFCGLALFCGFGAPYISISNLTPMWGAGAGTILKGSMTAFYAYTGLYIVAEVGDEVQNAQRNIPRSIIISSAVVGFLYLGTTLTFAGGLGWDTIKALRPNLVQAAQLMLNPWVAGLVQLGAVLAIITPMNASYMASSRSLYSLSVDGMMPRVFSRLNRYNVPGLATVTIYIPALLVVVLDLPVLFLGTVSSIVLLSSMTLVAGACLMLKKKYPEQFQRAPFRLSDTALKILPVFTALAAALLTIVSLAEDLLILYSFGFWMLTGWIYYYAWKKSCKRKAKFKPTR